MTDNKILIVDTSLTVRMDLQKAVRAAGMDAIPCASVAEGRAALARADVGAVVLDPLVPDGAELLTELRTSREHKAKPVVLLCTEAEAGDRLPDLRRGAEEYVGKPYDARHVVARVRELMDASQAGPPTEPLILIIDDSMTYRMAVQSQLEDNGYRVLTAPTGEDGLRVAAEQRPDALVVDGMLPGIDGATVIRRVRLDAALRDLPCLLLTSATDRDTELRVLEAGADAFVRKDEDGAVLLARLAGILRPGAVAGAVDEISSLNGKMRILAVDDSVTYLNATADSLRGRGYEVYLARSGAEALELLAAQVVDCILLDVVMTGLNGQETFERVKQVPAVRDVPLIMVTSIDDPGVMLACLGIGADDFIRKADGLEILEARVRAQLRRKQFQDENRRVREAVQLRGLQAAEAQAARELAQTRTALVEALEWKNRELESFSYSVAHDLRGPLQIVEGYSEVLLENDGHLLNESAQRRLERINVAAKRMGQLVTALLELAHASRAEVTTELVDVSAMAREIATDLRAEAPDRVAVFAVEEGMTTQADASLLRAVLTNILGNAWKFTRRTESTLIRVGSQTAGGETTFCVSDNGAGFDAASADALFRPFGRLHHDREFAGTGIGLATVQRIVDRHNGQVWAESRVGHGATFYFTLGPAPAPGPLATGAAHPLPTIDVGPTAPLLPIGVDPDTPLLPIGAGPAAPLPLLGQQVLPDGRQQR
jgi:DNA-binding response OmpR family regulator